jgi:formyl-CoA transferase
LTRTTAEWMSICNQFDIPATPLYSLDELPEHPQLVATSLFQTMEHPSEGTVRYIRPPTKFARTPAAVRGAAPRVGEHSCEILREAGLQDDEINALLSSKTVKQHEPQ